MTEPSVSVCIVTYNSSRHIRPCLDAVLAQDGVRFEVVVVDNASTDGTREIVEGYRGRVRIIHNPHNEGFAAGQNRAIRSGGAPWALTLNPDVLMEPGFIRRLLDAAEWDPGAGAVCGKLLSIGPGFRHLPERLIDSAGLYFTPEMRHFDRGWHEPDGERFARAEYVFGASGAAALYRRAMIDDVAVEGEFFDPAFFCYREDADVAWRAQLLGWRCVYAPAAVAYHVRSCVPGDRRSLSPLLNMHSVKNRFLMRIKNATPGLYRTHWLAATLRDALVLGACFGYEPASLGALWRIAAGWRRALRWRRRIMSRRRAADADLAPWFASAPVTRPIPTGGSHPGHVLAPVAG